MTDTGGVQIAPFGPGNLQAPPPPKRGTVPGSGGTIYSPDRMAIRMPAPETAEEWRHDDDDRKLALANPGDLKRLDKEQDRLDHAERVVTAAEAAHVRARDAVVAMRVDGKPAAKAEETLTRAEASLAKAKRELAIAGEVVAVLRKQIIDQVRQGLAATARSKLQVAHQLYDDALARLGQTSALLDAMRTARQAERQAAAQLASALGVTPGPVNGKRGESATGSAFKTIGDDLDLVVLIVDRKPDPIRLEGGAVAGVLARRSDTSG